MFRPSEQSPRDPRRTPPGASRSSLGSRSAGAAKRKGAQLAELDGPSIRGAWLVAPMLLLALAAALRLAGRGTDPNFSLCFALLLGLGVAWVAIRLGLPLPAPPECPHCRRKTLVRLDALQTAGARCLHCGWRDEGADARQLNAVVALEPHFRGAVHGARPAMAPREARPGRSGFSRDSHGRESGGRPPRGPSGRGRRLR